MVRSKIVRDGHIHSPYCPHGSNDKFEEYIDKAIEEGLEEITFTEHMPFPEKYLVDHKDQMASPSEENFEKYIADLKVIKEKYKGKIKINIGAEVDYLEGLELETKALLDKYGVNFDDSILSVHMVRLNGVYRSIDYNTDLFKELIDDMNGLENVYNLYYETLLKSIQADLGIYKPRRIGHPTLVRVYNTVFPFEYTNIELLTKVVNAIKIRDYEIDHNTAGLRKPYCKEVYPSGLFKKLVEEYKVREVYGSDSHASQDVAYSFK